MKDQTPDTQAVLETPALNERLIASVKTNFDSPQQEAILMLESQLNDLAKQVQSAARSS
ncbi:MAG: hypothetical protein AAGB01_02355 [Cyanobacteria bacterium P01_F01_bin.42]